MGVLCVLHDNRFVEVCAQSVTGVWWHLLVWTSVTRGAMWGYACAVSSTWGVCSASGRMMRDVTGVDERLQIHVCRASASIKPTHALLVPFPGGHPILCTKRQTSAHSLQIEKGRYYRPQKIHIEERFFLHCTAGDVKDEMHFFMLVLSRDKCDLSNGYMYNFSQFFKFAPHWPIYFQYESKWLCHCKSYNKVNENVPRQQRTTVNHVAPVILYF